MGRKILDIKDISLFLNLVAIVVMGFCIAIRELKIQHHLQIQRAAEENCRSFEAEFLVATALITTEQADFQKMSLAMLVAFTILDEKRLATIEDLQARLKAMCNIAGRIHGDLNQYIADPDTTIRVIQQLEDRLGTLQDEHHRNHEDQMTRGFRLETRIVDLDGFVQNARLMLDEIRTENAELKNRVPDYIEKKGENLSREEREQKEKELFRDEGKKDLDILRDDHAQTVKDLQRWKTTNAQTLIELQRCETSNASYKIENAKLQQDYDLLQRIRVENVRVFAPVDPLKYSY